MRRRLPSEGRRHVPRTVLLLIFGLVAVAAGAAAWSERLDQAVRPISPVPVLGLLVALTASAYLHVEFRHGDRDVNALDLFEAGLAPVVLLLPTPEVLALVVVAKVVVEGLLLRVQPVKAAFNVAAWSAAAAVGSLVLTALGGSRALDGGGLLALAVAMVAVTVVNQVAFVSVLRLSDGRTFREVVAELRPAIVPAWLVGGGVTLSFGLLFAAACAWEPVLAWLLLVPLGALHWASQTYASSRVALMRVEGLHLASRALASSQEPGVAIAAFLDHVRVAFQADAVDLVAADGAVVSVQRAVASSLAAGRRAVDQTGAGVDGPDAGAPDLELATALLDFDEVARVTVLSTHPVLSAGLRRQGWRDCLIAPVVASESGRRALCVYEPRGLRTIDRIDLGVLDGLAGEVGAALARADVQASLRASEARFRALVQHSSDVVVVADADGIATEVLPSATSPTLSSGIGRSILHGAHPDDVAGISERFADVVGRAGAVTTYTWRAAGADGTWRHLETIATNLLDDPAVAGIILNGRDITERERAAALVAGQAEVLRSISRRSPLEQTVEALGRSVEPLAAGSHYTVVLFPEPDSAQEVLGSTLPQPLIDELAVALTGRDARERPLIVGDIGQDPRWTAAVGAGSVGAVWAAPIERSDGTGSLGLAILHFDHPRVADASDLRVLASAAELTHIAVEAVAAQARLVHQATHDALTGLPNRVLFLDRTTVALSRLGRSSASVAVLFLDLDRFKAVNDSLGHDVGDRLLVSLAGRLEAAMRPSDTVARFGGDEFTILCEDIGGEDEAVAIAERVRAVLASPTSLEGHELYVTASVGIAHTADQRRVPQELVEDADTAMYRAKRAGGDVHQVHDRAARSRALLQLVTHQALRKAIERGQLLVHYQPTVDLRTGRTVGAEALVRWDHPDHGLMGAMDFVPLAEETGLIVPLGALVLNEACRQQRQWMQEGGAGPGFTMSVNLSPKQFLDPRLPETVASALSSSGASPDALALEITETALMEHAGTTLATLHALKALGVRLAIDDFGIGYSSLMYLKRFPIDIIKVDKSFVGGLVSGPGDEAIVGTVVRLAHSLGMTAVAEGVETDAQVRRLQALRCDVGQGYWFGRPVPADEVVLSQGRVIDLRSPTGDR